MADERQREYQRKYDKKTKMISVKYILSDMREYDRLKEYLEKCICRSLNTHCTLKLYQYIGCSVPSIRADVPSGK